MIMMFMCKREREKERDREKEREKEREKVIGVFSRHIHTQYSD
jgi:hypothetical protein